MPGASGIIGTRHTLAAKPDGYTLMMDNHAVSAMLAASQMDLPFKWETRTGILPGDHRSRLLHGQAGFPLERSKGSC